MAYECPKCHWMTSNSYICEWCDELFPRRSPPAPPKEKSGYVKVASIALALIVLPVAFFVSIAPVLLVAVAAIVVYVVRMKE